MLVDILYPTRKIGFCASAVSLLEIVLLAAHDQRLWQYSGFPWHARLLMVVMSLLVTAVVCWLLYWLARCLAACRRSAAARIACVWLGTVAFALALFAYAASWSAMWKTGRFADLDSVLFASRNFSILCEYLWQTEPLLGIFLGVVALVGAGIGGSACYVTSSLPSGSSRMIPRWQFLEGGLVAAMTGGLVVLIALLYGDPAGPPVQTREWWNDVRPGRSLAIGYRVHPVLTATCGHLFIRDDHQELDLSPAELGLLRAAPREEQASAVEPRLSLIMIQIESLRHDVLYQKHQDQEVMPALNRLAASGLNFTRTYAQSTHSNYADPAILSSLYPLRTNHHHYYSLADPWPKTLVYDVAKSHNYATAIVSSQNELWGGMEAFLKSRNLDLFFDSRSSDARKNVDESDITFARYALATGIGGKLDDRLTISRAIQWIDDCQRRSQPYVLCVNLQTSHFPYQLPEGAQTPFQPCEMNFSASFVKYPLDKVPIVKNAYFNALHYIDEQLAGLVAYLDEHRLRESTLLVVVGDNGECFYENGYSSHAGPPFEPAIHVPLVMNCPGTLAPRNDDYLVQGIDVVPTALSLMGLPLSPCFQGTDVLTKDRLPPERRLVLNHNSTLVRATADAIISGIGWKYVFDRKTRIGTLYDLRTDPEELNPCDSKQPAVRQTLDRILQRWRNVQLTYYARPDYYGIYFPPPTPLLSDSDFAILQR